MARKKYDREYLVAKVAELRINGKATHTILNFLMGDKIGMSRKIAYEILGDAQKYVMEQQNDDFNKAFADALSRLEQLYEEGDNKSRLEVQKEINKLRGLYSADKLDITSGGKAIENININIINKKENDSE